ncbi:MAG: DUF4159 domain-containing protein [Bryobacteraceae bacterium]
MVAGRARVAAVVAMPLLAGLAGALQIRWRETPVVMPGFPATAEFHFLRVEYVDLFTSRRGFGGRGWWMQDWPEADAHFAQGVRRLTRIDIGEGKHLPLTDDRIYDYPWVYATQVGYWNLSDAETRRLREYLSRGGFLVVDDFYGPDDWAVFRETMQRVFPDRPILEIEPDHPMMHVLFDINERTFIPGLRHLRMGPGGMVTAQQQAMPPSWRAIFDDKGRMVVAINFNMDVGDAWEHADMPEYPAEMTGLAYRFGINYIIYSMTH